MPLVPPTPERVEAMLASTDRDPGESLGKLPPRLGDATVEKVAINAVMAGCRPEYFPVVLASIRASRWAVEAGDSSSPRLSRASPSVSASGVMPSGGAVTS